MFKTHGKTIILTDLFAQSTIQVYGATTSMNGNKIQYYTVLRITIIISLHSV